MYSSAGALAIQQAVDNWYCWNPNHTSASSCGPFAVAILQSSLQSSTGLLWFVDRSSIRPRDAPWTIFNLRGWSLLHYDASWTAAWRSVRILLRTASWHIERSNTCCCCCCQYCCCGQQNGTPNGGATLPKRQFNSLRVVRNATQHAAELYILFRETAYWRLITKKWGWTVIETHANLVYTIEIWSTLVSWKSPSWRAACYDTVGRAHNGLIYLFIYGWHSNYTTKSMRQASSLNFRQSDGWTQNWTELMHCSPCSYFGRYTVGKKTERCFHVCVECACC